MSIFLPGDAGFYETLAITPPDPLCEHNFVVRSGSLVAEPVSDDELEEYLLGGEYDEKLMQNEEMERSLNPTPLYLPCSLVVDGDEYELD
ncbi:hypothetical protein ACQ4M4_18085 [Leptolyngbya sp. AN02str]|uniref:hypothetical protein n=1 Tax=Leptolyngbya sp. AN02str TaxID=3423363 RepID=UPI003D31E522